MILKRGAKGPRVKSLQSALNALNFNCGPVDGVFGPGTEKKVEQFQESVQIYSDGIVGKNTIKILNQCLKLSGHSKLILEAEEDQDCPMPEVKHQWVRVPADQVPGSRGYNRFTIRADAAESYLALREEVLKLGGCITSAGGRRSLASTKKSKSKSTKSMHYVGLAIDLALDSGMGHRPEDQRYAIELVGERNWNVWCKTKNPKVPERTIEAYTYHHNKKIIKGRYFSFTDLAIAHGWSPIKARTWFISGGKYTGAEWWHFQYEAPLEKEKSKFGTELLKVYSEEECKKFLYWNESKNCTFGVDWF